MLCNDCYFFIIAHCSYFIIGRGLLQRLLNKFDKKITDSVATAPSRPSSMVPIPRKAFPMTFSKVFPLVFSWGFPKIFPRVFSKTFSGAHGYYEKNSFSIPGILLFCGYFLRHFQQLTHNAIVSDRNLYKLGMIEHFFLSYPYVI